MIIKSFNLIFLSCLITISVCGQTDTSDVNTDALLADMSAQIDSLEKSFSYQHGLVTLSNCHVTMQVPDGFGYLDPTQAKRVLEDLWGNPPSDCEGMLVPDDGGVLQDNSWAFEMTWDEMGFVDDGDAEDTDYPALLADMQKELVEANKMREQEGYPKITLHGWASPPFYDKEKKVLHWAKDLEFEESGFHTLNYNVRILGRKGVLVVNAIGQMDQLQQVSNHIPAIMTSVKFDEGYQYDDYDSNVDEVAAYTIGGLVAGKVLAKVGLFAVFAKFAKVIFIGIAAAGAAIWRWLSGRKKKETEAATEKLPESTV